MKKRIIGIVLFLFCGLILSGSVVCNKEESLDVNIRTIVLEDKELDLSYYEDKYDPYNEDNTCFEIVESYQSNYNVLGKNSSTSEIEIQFYVYVNKEEQYFLFSYEGNIGETVVSNNVRIELVEYEKNYYLVSSNGCVVPFEEVYKVKAIGNCYAITRNIGNLEELGGVINFSGAGGGGYGNGAGVAVAVIAVGAVALASSSGSTSGTSKALPSISGSSAAGSLPPNGNNNNNKKKSVKEIVDDIKDEYKQNGQCDKFADELETGMKENGISGERIKVTPKHSARYIESYKYGKIGDGFHEGIKIGDIIYDNLRPEGIPYTEWLSDLGGEYWVNIFKTLI